MNKLMFNSGSTGKMKESMDVLKMFIRFSMACAFGNSKWSCKSEYLRVLPFGSEYSKLMACGLLLHTRYMRSASGRIEFSPKSDSWPVRFFCRESRQMRHSSIL